jgi:hypothetical protein
MAKYVDLGAAGTGHAGTTGDPYSWADAITFVNALVPDTLYIKGQISTALWWAIQSTPTANGFSFLPWDLETNGPFRIRYAPVLEWRAYLFGSWSNCIIEASNSGPGAVGISFGSTWAGGEDDLCNYNNCFLKSASRMWPYTDAKGTFNFKGCTLITPLIQKGLQTTTMNFTDCILDVTTIQ